MFTLETLEAQICAVMETAVEVAVTELGALLDKCSVKANARNEEDETPPGGRQEFNKAVTSQFASLMEAWTKRAVEKIVLMLKASTCEAEDGPDVTEKQPGVKLKAGREAGPKKQSVSGSSRQKRKKINGGLGSTRKQKNDCLYSREESLIEEATTAADSDSVVKPAEADTHEGYSGSPSGPEAVLTEPPLELAHVNEKDVAQEDTGASTLTSMIKQKKTTGPFRCPSCDKQFALKCMMDRHHLTHTKPHLCSECGKRFAALRGLIGHMRRHTGEKLYKCSLCGTEFAYKNTFDRHMRQHRMKKPTTHTCTLCENQFHGVLAFQRHRCCALKKTFVCSLCPETFECRQSLADHENLHSGDKDFVCEMCGESFFSSASLATHRVTHTQKENCCDVLGVGCSDLSVLKNHLSKHTGEKLFTCQVCGKGCSHKSALKHHMLTHTGERPYVCETCGKRCGHASALENHMRVHTGKKPGQQLVCDVCGKKFRRTVNLKYHMSVHTGERPYACDRCDKKFSNPSNLKLHAMIHSEEKMYGCNICGRRFAQASGLKLHRRMHTGETPYHCAVCGKGFMYSGDFRKHQKGHLPDEPGDGPSVKTAVKI